MPPPAIRRTTRRRRRAGRRGTRLAAAPSPLQSSRAGRRPRPGCRGARVPGAAHLSRHAIIAFVTGGQRSLDRSYGVDDLLERPGGAVSARVRAASRSSPGSSGSRPSSASCQIASAAALSRGASSAAAFSPASGSFRSAAAMRPRPGKVLNRLICRNPEPLLFRRIECGGDEHIQHAGRVPACADSSCAARAATAAIATSPPSPIASLRDPCLTPIPATSSARRIAIFVVASACRSYAATSRSTGALPETLSRAIAASRRTSSSSRAPRSGDGFPRPPTP